MSGRDVSLRHYNPNAGEGFLRLSEICPERALHRSPGQTKRAMALFLTSSEREARSEIVDHRLVRHAGCDIVGFTTTHFERQLETARYVSHQIRPVHNDAFDVGIDSDSPVSPVYFDRKPFKFNRKINKFSVKYLSADD